MKITNAPSNFQQRAFRLCHTWMGGDGIDFMKQERDK
jgi:hypothetical protein